ncbi:MAG: gamma-glutamyltransferase, partial [candidate division Zixibacteria bacterium]|nr:gamma-glutamyltransferase [candidate division Zixibacteria bacterium]
MKKALILKAAIFLAVATICPAWSASPKPSVAHHGMVVSSESIAADIGLEILKSGGNAVDAAVATCIALNVTEGYNCGMGGGCFITLYWAETGEVFAVDGRERAPLGAHRDLYVNPADQTVIKGLSTEGATAVAAPGQPAALKLIHDRWGSLPWAELFEPAIAAADTGFVLSRTYAEKLSGSGDRLSQYPSSREIFFPHGDTIPYGFGDRLIQKDLARFLDSLSRNGADWFYNSRFAGDLA